MPSSYSSSALFFDYELPQDRIAQRPIGTGEDRSCSKLLVAHPGNPLPRIDESKFKRLPEFLSSGDVLVLNNTCVAPARFFVTRERDGRTFEALIVGSASSEAWFALIKPLKRLRIGDTLRFGSNLVARVRQRCDDRVLIDFVADEPVQEALAKSGLMPIPPYIRNGRSDELDRDSYQPCFASQRSGWGSVAAPTASLHFTQSLLSALRERGVVITELTLELGSASFLPVRGSEALLKSSLAQEKFKVPRSTWQTIQHGKERGSRVIAVGTTCVRALEAVARECNADQPTDVFDNWRDTQLFIKPGFEFQVVDAMITNFHQPRSTHLLLVNAFVGSAGTAAIYRHALDNDFRFLSYGDGSLLFR